MTNYVCMHMYVGLRMYVYRYSIHNYTCSCMLFPFIEHKYTGTYHVIINNINNTGLITYHEKRKAFVKKQESCFLSLYNSIYMYNNEYSQVNCTLELRENNYIRSTDNSYII